MVLQMRGSTKEGVNGRYKSTFVRKGGEVPRRGQNVEDKENMEEEVNTTYSLADGSFRSAAKRKRGRRKRKPRRRMGGREGVQDRGNQFSVKDSVVRTICQRLILFVK